jgi:hypothetical protein
MPVKRSHTDLNVPVGRSSTDTELGSDPSGHRSAIGTADSRQTRPLMPMTAGLLDEHVGHCVANAAAAGDQNKARDMVTEATQAIARIKT